MNFHYDQAPSSVVGGRSYQSFRSGSAQMCVPSVRLSAHQSLSTNQRLHYSQNDVFAVGNSSSYYEESAVLDETYEPTVPEPCGYCRGCRGAPCGRCLYCRDHVQSGAAGRFASEPCVFQRCILQLQHEIQMEKQYDLEAPPPGCGACRYCRLPDCGVCGPCVDRTFFGGSFFGTGAHCRGKRCERPRMNHDSYAFATPKQPAPQKKRKSTAKIVATQSSSFTQAAMVYHSMAGPSSAMNQLLDEPSAIPVVHSMAGDPQTHHGSTLKVNIPSKDRTKGPRVIPPQGQKKTKKPSVPKRKESLPNSRSSSASPAPATLKAKSAKKSRSKKRKVNNAAPEVSDGEIEPEILRKSLLCSGIQYSTAAKLTGNIELVLTETPAPLLEVLSMSASGGSSSPNSAPDNPSWLDCLPDGSQASSSPASDSPATEAKSLFDSSFSSEAQLLENGAVCINPDVGRTIDVPKSVMQAEEETSKLEAMRASQARQMEMARQQAIYHASKPTSFAERVQPSIYCVPTPLRTDGHVPMHMLRLPVRLMSPQQVIPPPPPLTPRPTFRPTTSSINGPVGVLNHLTPTHVHSQSTANFDFQPVRILHVGGPNINDLPSPLADLEVEKSSLLPVPNPMVQIACNGGGSAAFSNSAFPGESGSDASQQRSVQLLLKQVQVSSPRISSVQPIDSMEVAQHATVPPPPLPGLHVDCLGRTSTNP